MWILRYECHLARDFRNRAPQASRGPLALPGVVQQTLRGHQQPGRTPQLTLVDNDIDLTLHTELYRSGRR